MGFLQSVFGWFGLFIYEHPFLVSFLGPLIGGEPFFVALAFLSGQGFLPVWILFLTGTLADILDDIFWFHFPKWKKLHKIEVSRFFTNHLLKANKKFKKIEQHELFAFIMTSKFLIGSRILAVISISLNKVKFRQFIPYSIISAFIWSSIIISVGWNAGKGFSLIVELFGGVRVAATVILIAFAVLIVFRNYLHKHAHKKLVKNGKKD